LYIDRFIKIILFVQNLDYIRMRPGVLVKHAKHLCKGERRAVLQLPSRVAARRSWSALRIHETGVSWQSPSSLSLSPSSLLSWPSLLSPPSS